MTEMSCDLHGIRYTQKIINGAIIIILFAYNRQQ